MAEERRGAAWEAEIAASLTHCLQPGSGAAPWAAGGWAGSLGPVLEAHLEGCSGCGTLSPGTPGCASQHVAPDSWRVAPALRVPSLLQGEGGSARAAGHSLGLGRAALLFPGPDVYQGPWALPGAGAGGIRTLWPVLVLIPSWSSAGC